MGARPLPREEPDPERGLCVRPGCDATVFADVGTVTNGLCPDCYGDGVRVWRDQPAGNPHVRAFRNFCRRQGDAVHVLRESRVGMTFVVVEPVR